MKNFLISGLVDDKYRIKVNLLAISPDHAIKVFQQKYPKAEDIGLPGIPYWRNSGSAAILYLSRDGVAYAMCGSDFFCSEELNAKQGIHFMPISGGARRINSKVIFAADSYWCDSYDIHHAGKCRSGGWVNGSER